MNDEKPSQELSLCANCGREIQSRREKLQGRQMILCSQCYRELAFGDLRAKRAELEEQI